MGRLFLGSVPVENRRYDQLYQYYHFRPIWGRVESRMRYFRYKSYRSDVHFHSRCVS